jgi:hypothetical protein
MLKLLVAIFYRYFPRSVVARVRRWFVEKYCDSNMRYCLNELEDLERTIRGKDVSDLSASEKARMLELARRTGIELSEERRAKLEDRVA